MKKALLFINLGTPLSPNVSDVRSYLREFLTDPYVINLPSFFRYFLVYGIIAPFRGPKSAHAYKTIWNEERGSPLLYHSQDFIEKFNKLDHQYNHIGLAMRYGQPSIKEEVHKINQLQIDELQLFLMYPQYAESTTKTAIDEVVKHLGANVKLKILPYFYATEDYLNSMVKSLKGYSSFDYTLFSYHGLPESHIQKLDSSGSCLSAGCCEKLNEKRLSYCYRAQCYHTSKLLAERLELKYWGYSFQSRFGKKWVKPFTDIKVEELARQGIKKILVVSPAFVTDCLETLEELHIGLKQSFIEAGGEELVVAPCLNSNDSWVEACNNLTKQSELWKVWN